MAQGYSIDTVRVPLYRYFLTGMKAAGRALRTPVTEYEAITSTSVGSASIAENDLAVANIANVLEGDELVIVSGGSYLLVSGTLTIRIRIGGTIVATLSNFTAAAGAWRVVSNHVCRGSTILSSIELLSTASSATTAVVDNHRLQRTSTSPTLTAPVVKLTAQFSASDGSHDVTQEIYSLIRYRR